VNKKALLGSLAIIILLGIMTPAIAHIIDTTVIDNCGQPSILNTRHCRELEDQILNSTVRMMVESWVVNPGEEGYDISYSMGHATVMEDRYLVTHNHFNVPLNIRPREGDPESYTVIYLYNTSGEPLFKGPLSDFELAREDVETLVFAYKEKGLFEELGFSSAEFEAWPSLPLEAGMEVAQIDWDGTTTRVDWVKVQSVNVDEGAPRLVLADGVLPGASGGGIFLQGTHVANNWQLHEKVGAGGVVIEATSTVALNSDGILNS